MRLSTRTGLAALAAAVLSIVVLTLIASAQFESILRARVDEQLEDRAAASAAVLVAVGDRIAVSELNPVLEGARVVTTDGVIEVGRLPEDELPAVTAPGWRTVRADDEDWRLHAVDVTDVPSAGDQAIIEFAAPLGDVDARAQMLRRRTFAVGVLAAIVAGLAGLLFGLRASRPLSELRRDAANVGTGDPDTERVRDSYGTPEVDDVAGAINASLDDLSRANQRRELALAAARDFSASATHELRTPLQGAMTNLDVAIETAARAPSTPAGSEGVSAARAELGRMGATLAALQGLADADLALPSWFEPTDLADVADSVVLRRSADVDVDVDIEIVGDGAVAIVWPDGIRLALDNVLRNAIIHGRVSEGVARIVVSVSSTPPMIIVDDNGPGIAAEDRARVLAPFERGATAAAGSGLGLAVADRVARAHGGHVVIETSPLGGTRVRIGLAPSESPA